jgi:hypothetical protein
MCERVWTLPDVYGLKGQLLLCNAERLSAHVELNHVGVIHHAPTGTSPSVRGIWGGNRP